MPKDRLNQNVGESLEILVIEDNAADARLTQEVFKECKVRSVVRVIQEGEEAMRFLKREGEYGEARAPRLILLDLNLPKKSGREVLAEIKKDPQLCRIPVAILTTSQAPDDIAQAYDLHANCYIVKPVQFDQFFAAVRSMADFWLGVVQLPSH